MQEVQGQERLRESGLGDACDVTVIMPTTSWQEPFATCGRRVLDLIDEAPFAAEFIVVHDGPMPEPPTWLQRPDVTILCMRERMGPAAARNKAADRARGGVLFFVDADVELAADALERVHAAFDADEGLTAVFGAYDDAPAAPGVVSQFRNLLHHHTHVSHPGRAGTFWAGCGAVRAAQFQDVGGFDDTFNCPSVEDIELGSRIASQGGRIDLDPLLQCKHHKAWTLRSMLATDILSRAVPWTRLIVDSGRFPDALNVDWRNRLSGVLTVAAVAAAACAAWFGGGWPVAIACTAVVIALNFDFYLLCGRRRGPAFAVAAAALHLLFFIYSSITFGVVFLSRFVPGMRRGSCASPSRPATTASLDPEETSLPTDAATAATTALTA